MGFVRSRDIRALESEISKLEESIEKRELIDKLKSMKKEHKKYKALFR